MRRGDASHGVWFVDFTPETPYSSNAALPITTSCSFNRTLWYKTANQFGREARAFMNVGNAYSTFWAPVVNILRDPRWGRNLECTGEDPFLRCGGCLAQGRTEEAIMWAYGGDR